MVADPSPIQLDPSLHADYPFESRYLKIDRWRYHYIDEGQGPPMVMVHGNPTWSFYYRGLIRAFSDRFRCIAMDHLGCGLSDKPHPRDYGYTLADRISDLDRLMTHLNLDNITLVVHDWGGMIGLAWALKNLERIRRIVVLNTFGFLLPRGKRVPWQLKLIQDLPWLAKPAILGGNLFARAAVHMASRQGLDPAARKGLLAPYDRWSNRWATLRFVQDIPLTPDHPSYEIVEWVDQHLHGLVQKPVLICWGKHDFVFNMEVLAEWRRRLPKARVEIAQNAGHYILEDAPQQTIQWIQSFCKPEPCP